MMMFMLSLMFLHVHESVSYSLDDLGHYTLLQVGNDYGKPLFDDHIFLFSLHVHLFLYQSLFALSLKLYVSRNTKGKTFSKFFSKSFGKRPLLQIFWKEHKNYFLCNPIFFKKRHIYFKNLESHIVFFFFSKNLERQPQNGYPLIDATNQAKKQSFKLPHQIVFFFFFQVLR